MTIHREGKKIIMVTGAFIFLIVLLMLLLVRDWNVVHYLFIAGLVVFGFMVTAFFRIPRRIFAESPNELISPADGTIVTIEQVTEKTYIKGECMQVSIFMSGTATIVYRGEYYL